MRAVLLVLLLLFGRLGGGGSFLAEAVPAEWPDAPGDRGDASLFGKCLGLEAAPAVRRFHQVPGPCSVPHALPSGGAHTLRPLHRSLARILDVPRHQPQVLTLLRGTLVARAPPVAVA